MHKCEGVEIAKISLFELLDMYITLWEHSIYSVPIAY